MLAFYFILLASAYSFLLDNPQGNGGTTITNQYLTISKFYEEMKLQQADTTNVRQETIKLRHDTDTSLTLLTSQLQQKFDLLDKKLAEIERQNNSNSDFVNLEHKYIQLEQKYLNLEQNYITQGHELAMLKNKSRLLDTSIEDLKHLGSIKPLHEITTLQQKVKSISAQTSLLNMKEQARSQDLIALYSKVQEHEATNNRSITDLSTKLNTLQTNHNASITNLGTELRNVEKNQSIHFVDVESKMRAATIMNNQTFIHLQRQIDTSTEQVAMTAHPSSSPTKSGIIKFDNVAFSVGIANLSAFKSSGKFVCEKEGLYLFSVSVYSNTNDAFFNIYLNGKRISYTYIGYNSNNPSSMGNTGAAVHALQLRLNDSVWVTYPGAYYVGSSDGSTFTIAKIK